LIRRFHGAKLAGDAEVTIWGTGTPRREFLYVDDLADALVHLLQLDNPPDWVNVGTGQDITIRELAELVAEIVGYDGRITNDTTKPDGTPVKCTDTTVLNELGWTPRTKLREGIERTYEYFVTETATSTIRV
jgi:GDP-L-fucose synthase